MKLLCPKRWNSVTVPAFLQSANKFRLHEDMSIDISDYSFGTPLPIMLMAMGLREIQDQRSESGMSLELWYDEDNKEIRYLSHIGFFQLLGYDLGKAPGQAAGNSNYLPITLIRRTDFKNVGRKDQLGDSVSIYSDGLASRIFSEENDPMRHRMLAYSLREVIRNVFEHAETDVCALMAQGWTNGFMEIVIVDRGLGLFGSLSRTFDLASVDDAIHLALQPGVSRFRQEQIGQTENSGFGLYILSTMGKHYGEFSIGSGDRLLTFNSQTGIISEQWQNVPIKGTVVGLRANTAEADYFPNFLRRTVQQGEEASGLNLAAGVQSLSKRSR